jgi:adenylosuccinate synthase
VRDRLAAVRAQIQADLTPILSSDFLAADQELASEEIANLTDDGFLDYVADLFTQVANLVRIVPGDYMATEVLGPEGIVVVESSHGILTDQRYGFHPHTSAIRTLPQFTRQMIEETGYDGQIVSLAVHRAYTIRHGAGPMPTDDLSMLGALLPGSHKDENRYQGHVRTGPLDLQLLEYALRVSGPAAYDGIAITWFDQVAQNGEWYICPRYSAGTDDEECFTESGALRVRHFGTEADQLAYQARLTERLFGVTPETQVRRIPVNASGTQLAVLCAATLNERLGVPVRMVSLGPTERNKVTI